MSAKELAEIASKSGFISFYDGFAKKLGLKVPQPEIKEYKNVSHTALFIPVKSKKFVQEETKAGHQVSLYRLNKSQVSHVNSNPSENVEEPASSLGMTLNLVVSTSGRKYLDFGVLSMIEYTDVVEKKGVYIDTAENPKRKSLAKVLDLSTRAYISNLKKVSKQFGLPNDFEIRVKNRNSTLRIIPKHKGIGSHKGNEVFILAWTVVD